MYQAVWKLAALSVVVAVGVLVVVLAQRGMQEDDAADKNDVVATDSDTNADDQEEMVEAGEPPLQGEPEMADDPFGAAVSVAGRNARRKSSAPRRNPVAGDEDLDDDDQPIQRTANVNNDPFGDDDAGSAGASAAVRARRKAPTTAGQKRGPALMLDSPDEDESAPESDADSEEPKGNGSGPRLLGASSNARPASDRKPAAARINDDPFANEDDAPEAPARIRDALPDDDDETDLAADSTPPAKLPRTTPGTPRSLRGIQPDDSDDDDALETPAINRSSPQTSRIADEAATADGSDDAGAADGDADEKGETTSKLPAAERRTSRPLDTIEPDDDRPVKLRPGKDTGKGPDLGPVIETAPEEAPPPQPDKRTGEPALLDADSTPPDDAPVDDDPAAGKPDLPQLTIDKVAPPTAVLGEPMIYHIQVRNNGYLPAHNVTVEDIVPENVKIDGSIPQAQLKQNRLVWKLGTLPAGQEKKIAVRVIPQSEGTIGGVATVNFTPPSPAAPPANRNAPRIKFVVESPRKAAVGMPVDFKFKIQNVGKVPATGVTIRDVLPAGLKHAEGDDLEFTIGQIPPGKSQDVKLTLTAAVTGPTVNRVVVTADGNVSEEAEVQLEVVGPQLAVARSGPKKLFPGKVGRYANTVTNPGGQSLSGATLLEVVPAGMEFVEADQGGLYDPVKRNVIWQLKQLNPGESKTVKVSLRPTARGAQISVVRAFDSSGASGETVGTTQVAGVPALKIEFGELASLVEPGEMVKVPVRVFNRGSDAATAVRTSVVVPAGMQFVSARAPVDHRVQPAAGGEGQSCAEVQFAPIGKIDAKGDAVYELTFKARVPGATRVEVQTRCEQMSEAIRSEEPVTIVAPQ